MDIRLIRDGAPAVARLRYAAGAGVCRRRHDWHKTVVMPDGVKINRHSSYPARAVVMNSESTRHRVWSDGDRMVLSLENRKMEFISAARPRCR